MYEANTRNVVSNQVTPKYQMINRIGRNEINASLQS